METLQKVLDPERIKKVENDGVFYCLNESRSSQFYAELFSDSFKGKNKPQLYDEVKHEEQKKNAAYRIMEEIVGDLENRLNPEAVVVEIGGGVYQRRSAFAYKRFRNYFPLDISYTSIKRYNDRYAKCGIVADATELPFKNNSVDCIFTHTFLEHPLDPEKVLSEIVRVLKPNGIVVHNDAWFCRWWQRYGIVGLKPYSNLSAKEKMIWIGAKITELQIIRIPPVLLRRVVDMIFQPKAKRLRYGKLRPNYDLHLGCDEDAANTIDPVDVIRYYEARNFELVNPMTYKQRLLHPNKYITLQKKN